MNRQTAARRRVKKRKTPGQNSRVKFGTILGIMLLAVFLGYLTARFVVGPVIGYDADESPAKITGEAGKDSEKDAEKTGEKSSEAAGTAEGGEKSDSGGKSVPADGFALQFGAFSTREAAEKLASSLKAQGISAEIVEADDVFKVISPVVDTKEKALDELEGLSDKEIEDVFITSFQ